MDSWQLQDAKARFSEFLDAALKKGPQTVICSGVETAILVSMEQWRRVHSGARPSLKDLLLAPEPRFEMIIPPRRKVRRRKPIKFT